MRAVFPYDVAFVFVSVRKTTHTRTEISAQRHTTLLRCGDLIVWLCRICGVGGSRSKTDRLPGRCLLPSLVSRAKSSSHSHIHLSLSLLFYVEMRVKLCCLHLHKCVCVCMTKPTEKAPDRPVRRCVYVTTNRLSHKSSQRRAKTTAANGVK